MKYTKEKFIELANKKHNNKYDYSKVDYIDSQTKVLIICPDHGSFWQAPSAHLRGNECPLCANKKRGRKLTQDEFVDMSIKVHGVKYSYEKAVYEGCEKKVCIICPEHGEFWQTPLQHIFEKQGCPKCVGRNLSTEEVIEKFYDVHGNKYDYSNVIYSKMHEKVCIVCPEHGEFWQTPSKHLCGQGCPKCGKISCSIKNQLTKEEFIEKSRKIHGDKYDYSKVVYKGRGTKVEIVCPFHGSFWQFPFDHLEGHACPKCGIVISNDEFDIYRHVCEKIGSDNVVMRERKAMKNGKEIDIYVPSLKLGLEYNGLYWHSEESGKGKDYHIAKTKACNDNGIKLLQIFEDEYRYKKNIVFSKIDRALGVCNNMPKVMARKTVIKELKKEDAKIFLEKNHIQGYTNSTISLGAFLEDRLVGVMSFVNMKNGIWNLTRFATDNDYVCQGIGGKLFSYFIKTYDPDKVKTFADIRWTPKSEDNFYTKLGFKLDAVLKPDYRYINKSTPRQRIHKFNLRKKTLHRKYGFNMDMTEKEMVKKLNLVKIWDCGLYRYIWKKIKKP